MAIQVFNWGYRIPLRRRFESVPIGEFFNQICACLLQPTGRRWLRPRILEERRSMTRLAATCPRGSVGRIRSPRGPEDDFRRRSTRPRSLPPQVSTQQPVGPVRRQGLWGLHLDLSANQRSDSRICSHRRRRAQPKYPVLRHPTVGLDW